METVPTSLVKRNPVELLSVPEREAYERFLRSDKAPLGPDLSARLFESFLNGKTCSDIQHDNCELSFGAIVDARVRDNWDEQRATYMQKLLEKAGNRALRAQLEAVDFVFEMFQITHLVSRQKFEEYRRTKDLKALEGALQVASVKQYKDLIMSLALLAGKSGSGEDGGLPLPHPSAAAGGTAAALTPGERPVPALESADFLTQAASRRREENAREAAERKTLDEKKATRRPQPPKKEEEDDE